MSGHTAHTFVVEVWRRGARIGARAASLASCFEDAHFRAVLAGEIANDGVVPEMRATPVWHETGAPAVIAVDVRRAGARARRYPRSVFHATARRIVHALTASQQVAGDDAITWSVTATPRDRPSASRFGTRVTREPYPLRSTALDDVERGSIAVDVAPALLADLTERVLGSLGVEQAGLLAGSIDHDPARGAAVLRVTGHVPLAAGRAGASDSHFGLDASSLAPARRLLAERFAASAALGWWHSHPACAACVHADECRKDTIFFSPPDTEVHESLFPAAYAIALVLGKEGNRSALEPGCRLFGWQHGTIVERPLERMREEEEHGDSDHPVDPR